MPPDVPVVLRTGPWRGAALLTGAAWGLLHGATLVLGLRADPYAVGLASDVPVTLVDGVDALAARLAKAVEAVEGAGLLPRGATPVAHEPGPAGDRFADTDPAGGAFADSDRTGDPFADPDRTGDPFADPDRTGDPFADPDRTGDIGADIGRTARTLADIDRTGSVVVLDSGHLPELTAYLDQQQGWGRVMVGKPAITGLGLLDVVAVMDRLRSPGGCPWDAEQTHASLRPYLLEEAQEAAEAIDSGDRAHLAEELGDVLLQVVFHARLGREDVSEPFDIDDVAAGLVAKLVRRHPHVFGDVVAHTPEQVAANWERIKAAEKGS